MYHIMFTWRWLSVAETCCDEASVIYTRRELVVRKEQMFIIFKIQTQSKMSEEMCVPQQAG
jgi:hypothetical protein